MINQGDYINQKINYVKSKGFFISNNFSPVVLNFFKDINRCFSLIQKNLEIPIKDSLSSVSGDQLISISRILTKKSFDKVSFFDAPQVH